MPMASGALIRRDLTSTGDDRDREDQRREGEDHVHAAHEQVVHGSTGVAGHRAQECACEDGANPMVMNPTLSKARSGADDKRLSSSRMLPSRP